MLNITKIRGYFLNESGVFPILILVALAAALVGGGTYVVKNNLVTTQNGQIVFNASKDKILSDIKLPSPKPDTSENTPIPKKVELADKTAEYKPDTGEPKFSIIPPAGWVKGEVGGKVKLTFEGPQEDKKEIGGGGYVSSAPNIQITVEKAGNIKNLDEAIAFTKSQVSKISEVEIELTTEKKTTLNGMETYYSEFNLGLPNVNYSELRQYLKQQGKTTSTEGIEATLKESKARAASYLLLKDGYAIGLSGVALASFWDKRSPAILASFNSFKFLDDTNAPTELSGLARFPEYSAAQKGEFSYDPASWLIQKSSGKAFPKFKINIPSGWMQKISEYKEDQSFRLELRPIDNDTNPNGKQTLDQAVVLIVIRKDDHTSAEQFVIDTFGRSQIRELRKYEAVKNNGHEGRYLEQEGGSKTLAEYIYLINGFSINISGTAPSEIWNQISPSLKQTINSFAFVN